MRTRPDIVSGHFCLAQIAAVVFTSTAFVLWTDSIGFRSLVNVLWMVGIPVALSLAMNRNGPRRAYMALELTFVSLIVTMAVGVNFTSYG